MCDVQACAYPRTAYSVACVSDTGLSIVTTVTRCRSGVTKTELKPYRRAVRDLSQRPRREERAHRAEESLAGSGQDCRGVRRGGSPEGQTPQQERENRPPSRPRYCQRNTTPTTVAELLMAFGYWLQFEPRRFRSQDAFQFQVVRLFRRLNGSRSLRLQTGWGHAEKDDLPKDTQERSRGYLGLLYRPSSVRRLRPD